MQLTCSICYNDIKETCNIDSCDHIFCRDCITKWGREKTNTCPCCRGKFNTLTDINGKIIDYFIDKENNDDDEYYDSFSEDEYYDSFSEYSIYYNYEFYEPIRYIYILYCRICCPDLKKIFPEKVPSLPYRVKLNGSNKYKDMAHYQRN